jgi:hypothetical protein
MPRKRTTGRASEHPSLASRPLQRAQASGTQRGMTNAATHPAIDTPPDTPCEAVDATPSVFGYGSLVNRATHGYVPARHARLSGWRRAWRYTIHRQGPFLTAVPSPGDVIDGLVAAIPGGDWTALDLREAGYDRVPTPLPGVMVYAVPQVAVTPTGGGPILLSYVDVVLQGYLHEYGPAGVQGFAATTDGWDIPILNDRGAPRYPRHQRLTVDETALVDATLRDLGARIVMG